MPVIHLTDRTLIRISGADAEHFLQNLITTDLSPLGEGEARPGALLSPQGKILFDFLIARDGDGAFLLDCRADATADLQKRLMLYKLRAKVEISLQEQEPVAVSWDIDSASSKNDSAGLRDLRFNVPVFRHHRDLPEQDAVMEDWLRLRIAHGVAESGSDYVLGDAFPHDVLLDQNGGVGLRKGCYVGQEVVSRMQHRGTARRRLLIASGEGDLPAPGTEILAGGRAVGTLGTSSGKEGLAIARIDRVKSAMDSSQKLEADGILLSLAIPQWANFGFPETAGEGSEAP